MTDIKPLRLIAEASEDLEVISAAVQDAVVKAENMRFEARKRRFWLEVNRFRWEGDSKDKERVRALLAFDGVTSVRTRAISKSDPEMIFSILNVTFEPADEPPGGIIKILFAGDGELMLTVEVMDTTLLDSDYIWPTKHTPSHERRKG